MEVGEDVRDVVLTSEVVEGGEWGRTEDISEDMVSERVMMILLRWDVVNQVECA